MISFNNRFHGHSSLSFVYKNGQTFRSHLAVLKVIKNSRKKNSRMAVVISKKIIKSAVRRNRVRRRVYEYLRSRLDKLNNIYDIVIIVSSSDLLVISHNELTDQLDQLFDQAGIIGIPKNS